MATLALAALAGEATQAQDIGKVLRDFDQWRLDQMTPATSPRAGRDYTA